MTDSRTSSSANVTVTADTEFTPAAILADALANPTITNVSALMSLFNGTTWDRIRGGITANGTSVTGMLNTLGMARYNASPTARTEGQFGNLQADSNGNLMVSSGTLGAGEDQTNNLIATARKPLAVTTYSLSWDDSAALEASSVTKASAGNVYHVFGFNTNAATRYFQLYNSTTVPADTTVPLVSIPVPASSVFSLSLPDYGKQFTTGIAWANSTTAATKTVGGSDFWVNVGYL